MGVHGDGRHLLEGAGLDDGGDQRGADDADDQRDGEHGHDGRLAEV